MVKKIILGTLIASRLFAGTQNSDTTGVKKFLENALKSNPSLSNVNVKVRNIKDVDGLKGWKAENITVSATISEKGNIRKINEPSTYFSNGTFMTNSLTNIKTGMQVTLEPKFLKSYYLKSNIISGNSKSKYKVVIFSDPLCPFCKKFVPKTLRALKKYPEKFAIYYYDFPLSNLHPASETLVKIGEHNRHVKGASKIDAVLDMYDSEINPSTRDSQKILSSYNDQFGTSVSMKDLKSKKTLGNIRKIKEIASKLNINGTPTFFYDGNKGTPDTYKLYMKK